MEDTNPKNLTNEGLQRWARAEALKAAASYCGVRNTPPSHVAKLAERWLDYILFGDLPEGLV